jgi:hypothetical protein
MSDAYARLLAETPLTPAAAATMLRTSYPTVVRWITAGLPVGGRKVKLEAVRVGVRWATSVEAVHRFLEAINQPDTPVTPAKRPAVAGGASPANRAKLAKLGIKV